MIDHAPDKLLNFRRQGLTLGQALIFLAETLTLQRLTPIGSQVHGPEDDTLFATLWSRIPRGQNAFTNVPTVTCGQLIPRKFSNAVCEYWSCRK